MRFHSEIKFIRSTCMNMELMTICFIVIAVDFSHEYENLAFRKSARQSTTYDPTVGSEKAVDGLKSDFSHSGKQCSISKDNKKTATWWVDLGRILSINNIVVYYRTDGNTWNASNDYTGRFLGFFIYVSNTTDRHAGHVCFHDTYYTRSTIPPMVNISCPLHGRYVIYYNERLPDINYPSDYSTDAYIELCEVEVYGCSMPRRYGPDCSLSCPVNCEDYCHIQTGICFECKPGKKGAFCEQGPAKDATDWRSRFYGVLAALCVCIAMFMMFIVAMFLRRRSSSGMDRENKGKDNKDEPCNISVTVKAEEIINSGYQGLEDQNESSAYDFIR